MIRPGRDLSGLFIVGVSLALIFSGCLPSRSDGKHGLEVTLKNAYQGVKDGNIESIALPSGSRYVTVELCVENFSAAERIIPLQDVFIAAGDNSPIFPVGLGYDQAEAFNWLLPLIEPIGGTHIDHKFYFFLIQSSEITRLPASGSQGCRTSSQFTSLALLFIVPEDMAGQPYTLHFLEEDLRFTAGKVLALSDYVKWGAGSGFLLILVVVVVIVVRKRKSKAQAAAGLG